MSNLLSLLNGLSEEKSRFSKKRKSYNTHFSTGQPRYNRMLDIDSELERYERQVLTGQGQSTSSALNRLDKAFDKSVIDIQRVLTSLRSSSLFPQGLSQGQSDGITASITYWNTQSAFTDNRWLAYVLATAYHETGRRMQPVREGFGNTDADSIRIVTAYCLQHNRPNYAAVQPNGHSYFGRGFVQLTHRDNYRRMGQRLHVDLENNPSLALDISISTQIIFTGMVEGMFTGRRLSEFFNGTEADWQNARRIVNGVNSAQNIAGYARVFESCINNSVLSGTVQGAAGSAVGGIAGAISGAAAPSVPVAQETVKRQLEETVNKAISQGLVHSDVLSMFQELIQQVSSHNISYAKSVTGVVNGGVITDPFYRDAAEKMSLTHHQGGRQQHLGVDISLSNAAGGGISDPRRGLPVYAAIRTSIPLPDLNSVRAVGRTGLGLNGAGNANLLNAQVFIQPWSSPGDAYGGVLGLACRYNYTNANNTLETFTLYLEFLHLITTSFPPKDGQGHLIPAAQWVSGDGIRTGPNGINFGPKMINRSVLQLAEFAQANIPLVGYLGATEFPHVHLQAAYAPGVRGYLRELRFDPAVMIY